MPKGYPKSGTRRISPENRCAICKHPERPRIEALHCAGLSLDQLAEKFEVSRDSIWRHMQKHVTEERKASYLIGPAKIAQLAEIAAEESGSLLDYFGILRSTLFFQLDRLAAANDHVGVAAMTGQLVSVLDKIGRLSGQLSSIANSTVININNNSVILSSPPFVDLQSGLLQVVAAHPGARADILALFKSLDAKYAPAPAAQKTIEASANV